ncbi:unnamed protein product [Mytilus coruscus]|uniref:RING-type domain-containing protein n=1 Tax=Mytilus coruscus TaxID=42192 RepID=A0A6J8BYG3_MYTCO|nr:unnamed protein product [Mytilus coruscus]
MTICSICLEHLEQPVCCIPCGHLYCSSCIGDWRIGHDNRCPECMETITTVQSIYLDTEFIKELSVERTRLNGCVNELTATIEYLRKNTSDEDQKVRQLEEMKENFERAERTCQGLQLRNSVLNLELKQANTRNKSTSTWKGISVARFAKFIFLIFTSVFLYLGVCIFTEWFSENPEFLENVVLRHLQTLRGSSAFITSTFSSAASYVQYFNDTYTPAQQPVCCIPCGHLYCNRCISDWRNRHNNRCPECRKTFTTVQSIYLDTESIKELFVEKTRLDGSVNELTATIEHLRQNTSNEEPGNHCLYSEVEEVQTLNAVLLSDIDQKVLELEEMKDNFERAAATCQSLQLQNSVLNLELKRANTRNRSTPTGKGFRRMIFLIERGVLDSIMFIEDNSEARFATIIFLIFTSVCFLYLGVCIFTEWFSEKPEFLEDIVVRHLQSLSGCSAFITSTFSSAASSVKYFIDTYTPACINYINICTNIIAEKASTYFNEDIPNFDYKLTVYWACLVLVIEMPIDNLDNRKLTIKSYLAVEHAQNQKETKSKYILY